jgi:predicted protein tyrosine phosphatase
MIHVCPLLLLHETVEETGARHVVTLLGDDVTVVRPAGVAAENHLWLRMHDIVDPLDGFRHPAAEHIEALIAFVHRWERAAPIVVHCHAGISRSTAAAFVTACALRPERDERTIAKALRRASATAQPNRRIVALADEVLARKGRMVAAVETMGAAKPAISALPFRLDLE